MLIFVCFYSTNLSNLSPKDCFLGNLERTREVRREDPFLYIPCYIAWTGRECGTERVKEKFNMKTDLSFFPASKNCLLRMK